MTFGLDALPAASWSAEALDWVAAEELPSTANHSVRSWIFARLLAEHENLTDEVDDGLLFAATVLHDIGLGREAKAPVRFEVCGADRAAEFLTKHGLPAAQVDQVWEAIALHTSPQIAERRSALTYLVRVGIGIDFGRGADILSDDQAHDVHRAYPRLEMTRDLVDAIVNQVRAVPSRGPRYSVAGELTRERSAPPYRSEMEHDADASRWKC